MVRSIEVPRSLACSHTIPTGITRLNRLQTIAGSSRYLGVDALRLALKEAKQGRNVDKYLELIWLAEQVAPQDPLTIKDQDWIESTSRQVRAETTRLENELKGYKNNLIKESIRVSLVDTDHDFKATRY